MRTVIWCLSFTEAVQATSHARRCAHAAHRDIVREGVKQIGEALSRWFHLPIIYMANCPKCGKSKIKRRNGVRRCRRCGPLWEPPRKDDDS